MVTLQENSVAVQTWLLQESLLKGVVGEQVEKMRIDCSKLDYQQHCRIVIQYYNYM